MRRLAAFALMLVLVVPVRAQTPSALLGSLPAPGPAGADSALQLYAPLHGDWDVTVIDHLANGARHTGTGEWHFDWVLEGRAMQDVWISPPRGEQRPAVGEASAFDRYGTTVRYFDPAIDAWRVTWVNPAQNYVATLVGRARGRDIVQEGSGDDGKMLRWIFSGITPTTFSWRGEVSTDSGRTWRTVQEMSGRRAARQSRSSAMSGNLMDALIAERPAAENEGALQLFGQFAGSWDSTLLLTNADGTIDNGRGEIHAGWVLEGRAVQDVWIFPKRGTTTSDGGREYGTTIRFFDRKAGNWRSIWISPVNHVTRSFRVHADGDEIFLEARTARGFPQKWIFSAITPNSFHWRNIMTPDDGRTWQLLEDVSARRMAKSPVSNR
jgi:hypothetical protein